jgi:hypothetical protein
MHSDRSNVLAGRPTACVPVARLVDRRAPLRKALCAPRVPGIDPELAHARFPVNKVSVGGIYVIPLAQHLKFGIGALVSKYGLPGELTPFYGGDPTSYVVFFRLKVS